MFVFTGTVPVHVPRPVAGKACSAIHPRSPSDHEPSTKLGDEQYISCDIIKRLDVSLFDFVVAVMA